MASRKLQIPSGMQDTLPGECARKRQLEQTLRHLFTLDFHAMAQGALTARFTISPETPKKG